ncbi:MAG: sigma-70 family RNA polymerase sigma factor [Verrucomicrobia bacterium]|nr:sigma-70 family RNA polymerase sigma factor [Verrucomicrobiota bacterium]
MSVDRQPDKVAWVHSILERYEGPLVRYAARITGDAERARDVVQETFVRLCAQERGDVDGHEAEWLFTVCRNRALDVQRKERRMKPAGDETIEDCPSSDPSPAAIAERDDSNSHVLRVLDSLPANQQEVIRLKFQNGLSYREISRITHLTVTNVGFLIHTGIRNLRHRLKAEFGLSTKL